MACGALFVLRVTILLFCFAGFSIKIFLFAAFLLLFRWNPRKTVSLHNGKRYG